MALRNLNFTLQGDRYVAEETVNADYALHLERKAGGGFYILQRSSDDGMFVSCPLPAGLYNPGQFIDWCFGHGVYPMHIRIESMTEVTIIPYRARNVWQAGTNPEIAWLLEPVACPSRTIQLHSVGRL